MVHIGIRVNESSYISGIYALDYPHEGEANISNINIPHKK